MELSSSGLGELVAEAIEAAGFSSKRPTEVGRYEIRCELGSGAMGTVYLAHDRELDRVVAIKRMKPSSRGARARFVREGRALAALSHPNVVTVYEATSHGDELFLVMEYVAGPTLRDWLGGPHSQREVLDVLLQAGQGLWAAHERGLVHRDFKPENVIIGDDGRVRVLDFGLVWSSDAGEPPADPRPPSTGPRITGARRTVGTPAYMAPEQATAGEVGPPADQYAFCVVLCEALCGERPRNAKDAAAMLRKAKVSRGLAGVIVRGLAARPRDRYPSVSVLLQRLQRLRRRGRTVGAAIAVGAVSVSLALLFGLDDPECDASRRTDEVWTQSDAAKVRDALSEILPSHLDGAQRVTSTLDEYAEQWRQRYGEVCRARGAMPGREFDRTMVCLDRALGRLGALTEQLRSSDVRLAARAEQAASGLPDLDHCSTSPSESGVTNVPALAKARALLDLGHPSEALEHANKARVVGEEIGSRSVIAEAELVRGTAHEALDEPVAGLGAYAAAYWAASEASRDDVAAEAASRRAILLLSHEARVDDGRAWLRHAESVSRPGQSPTLEAWLELARASLAAATDRRDDEELHVKRSVQILSDAYGPDDPRTAVPLVRAAVALRRAGEYESASRRLERAREIYVTAYGEGHPAVADVDFELGRVALSLDNIKTAAPRFDAAKKTYVRTYGPTHPRVAAVIGLEAAADHLDGRSVEAEQKAKAALDILAASGRHNHVALARPMRILGSIAKDRGLLGEAEQWLLRAEAIYAAAYGPDSSRVAHVLQRRAEIYRLRGEPKRAADLLRRVQSTVARVQGRNSPDYANAIGNLGTALLRTDRHDEGIALLTEAGDIYVARYGPLNPIVAQIENNLGSAELASGNHSRARAHFSRASQIADSYLGAKSPRRAFPIDGLGRVALAEGNVEEAVRRLEQAVELRRGPDGDALALVYSLEGLAEALGKIPGREADAAAALREAEAVEARLEE